MASGLAKIPEAMRLFLESEERFAKTIDLILKYFIPAFEDKNKENNEDAYYAPIAKYIFLHWDALKDVHDEFLRDLRQIKKHESSLSKASIAIKAFSDHYQNFMVFMIYTQNIHRQTHLLNKFESDERFYEILRGAERNARHKALENNIPSHTLEQLSHIPTNHIARYQVFLEELRNVLPHNTPERDQCDDMLSVMTDIAASVAQIFYDTYELEALEKEQNRIENFPRDIVESQAEDTCSLGFVRRDLRHFGKMLTSGTLDMKKDDETNFKKRHAILMDDIFILCTLQGSSNRPYVYETSYVFTHFWVGDDENEPPAERTFTIRLHIGDEEEDMIEYTCKDNPQGTFDTWHSTLDDIRQGQWDRMKAERHNVRKITFPMGAACSVCKKLLKGSFVQGYQCLNLRPPTTQAEPFVRVSVDKSRGCYQQFHRECLSKADYCQQNKDRPPTYSPSVPKQDLGWDGGQMSEDEARDWLSYCTEGSFIVRWEDKSKPEWGEGRTERQTYISIGVGKLSRVFKSTKTNVLLVHHKRILHEEKGYCLDFLEEAHPKDEEKFFPSIRELIHFFSTRTTVNLGTKDNPFKQGLKRPFKESLREQQRSQGALIMDWLDPPIEVTTLIKFGIINLRRNFKLQ